MRRILAALAFALLWTTPLRAAEFGGPGHDWRALRTENFEVVFHEGERFLALKAAVAAEEAYAQLVPRLLYRPKGIIRIVLVDNVDDSNGFSQQQPWNTIRIFVTRPHSEDRLDYYDEWMRTIVSHELTHAIHLDTVRAIPKFMRAVFGRTYFIHHVQPIFMVEGLAVHEETRLTTKGRNRSPLSEMMLRAASLEGEFPISTRRRRGRGNGRRARSSTSSAERSTNFSPSVMARNLSANILSSMRGKSGPSFSTTTPSSFSASRSRISGRNFGANPSRATWKPTTA
ncbi:MAG: hypothetical protein M5R36_21570 [Deltaproteobacteria bacterium]|nr:hypothetical protein [Deltaproteobacteria bacterium]